MPTLTTETVRVDGVTFVELLVDADRPHEVRIESHLDGPVWPPRTEGRPVDGWDETGLTATVRAGRTGFGFSTPAPPDGTAAELVAAELVAEDPCADASVPDGVATWLQRVEQRVETAESLAGVEDLREATRAVAAVGGLVAVEALAADLERDRRALSRLSFVPEDLAARADAVEVPTDAFARLAQAPSRRS